MLCIKWRIDQIEKNKEKITKKIKTKIKINYLSILKNYKFRQNF